MRPYREMTRALSLSVARKPEAIFFTVAFAPLLVAVLGAIFGNEPQSDFGGQGFIEMQLPALSGVVLAMMGVLTVPSDVVALREQGSLRRLRATPLKPGAFIAADLTCHFAMGLVGLLLALGCGAALFGLTPSGGAATIARVTCLLVLGLVAFMALGYLLAALLPSLAVVTPVGNVLVMALIMTSGVAIPLAVLSEGLRSVVERSPLTMFVKALQGLWQGEPLGEHVTALGVLGVMAVACGGAAVRLFRWE